MAITSRGRARFLFWFAHLAAKATQTIRGSRINEVTAKRIPKAPLSVFQWFPGGRSDTRFIALLGRCRVCVVLFSFGIAAVYGS